MKNRYPHKNRQGSRMLRNNATPEERKLWYDHLKNLPIRFKRQHPSGYYIVDFYCPQAGLVIELDGDSILRKEVRRRTSCGANT